ncbi:hypothetical protein OAG71_01125 [bacterium]|nr:hypothetical protein [bacterium]
MNNLYIAQKDPETGHLNFYNIEKKIQVPSSSLSPVSHLYSRTIERSSQHEEEKNLYKYSVFAEEKTVWTSITGRWVWSVETYVDEDLYMICDPDKEDHDLEREYIRIAFEATITVKQELGITGLTASVTFKNTPHPIWIPNVSCGMLCSGINRNPYSILSPTQLINMLNANEGNMDYAINAEYVLDSLRGVNEIEPQIDESRLDSGYADIIRLHTLKHPINT